MTFTCVIQIDDVEQTSDQFEVGVFCGEQCRGSQMAIFFPPTQRYLVQLTIFGVNGDQLSFKVYDHEVEEELDLESPQDIIFSSEGYGSLGNPYLLNFTSAEPGHVPDPSEVVITLNPGWNWISYLLTTERSLEETLINLNPSDGDIIKGQSGFSRYEAASSGWSGSLNTMIPGQGFLYLNNGTETKTFTYPK